MAISAFDMTYAGMLARMRAQEEYNARVMAQGIAAQEAESPVDGGELKPVEPLALPPPDEPENVDRTNAGPNSTGA